MRRIILVAPVQTGVYSGDRYKNIEILNPDDQFVDRDTQQSLFISPKPGFTDVIQFPTAWE